MVFGKADPLVTPAFAVLREIERIAECLRSVTALDDRREIEDGIEHEVDRSELGCDARAEPDHVAFGAASKAVS